MLFLGLALIDALVAIGAYFTGNPARHNSRVPTASSALTTAGIGTITAITPGAEPSRFMYQSTDRRNELPQREGRA
ncbi:hypothetical protein DFH09DRAFT_437939 [Mycena vulgaris]|nr:hypothetical protein DFH09DRAFT_437939 [Mycena vulgaris]